MINPAWLQRWQNPLTEQEDANGVFLWILKKNPPFYTLRSHLGRSDETMKNQLILHTGDQDLSMEDRLSSHGYHNNRLSVARPRLEDPAKFGHLYPVLLAKSSPVRTHAFMELSAGNFTEFEHDRDKFLH